MAAKLEMPQRLDLTGILKDPENAQIQEIYQLQCVCFHEIINKISQEKNTMAFLYERGVRLAGRFQEGNYSKIKDIGALVNGRNIQKDNSGLYLITLNLRDNNKYQGKPLNKLLKEFIDQN